MAFGFYYSFGIFFKDLQRDFGSTRADIALIASIMTFSHNIVAFASGWATDKYGPRIPVIVGGILFCSGLIISSRASSILQLYVFLGFMVGCSVSALFFPFVATVARWFVKLRGLTQGIIAAGIGVGMMIMAPISTKLLINYGWRTTFVIISIASLVIFGIASFLVKKNPEEKGLRPYGVAECSDGAAGAGDATKTDISARKDLSLREAMRTKDLWLLSGVMLTLPLAIFMVVTHLVNYASDTGMSPTSAAVLMTMVGAASIVGKVGAGALADRISSKTIIAVCAAVLTCLMLWLSTTMSIWMFRVFAIIYGLSYGGAFASSG